MYKRWGGRFGTKNKIRECNRCSPHIKSGTPRISVCMATYNGEAFIRQQLLSILSQLAETDEVLISDDGSADGTLDAIRAIGDPRVKILKHEKSKAKFTIDHSTANFENALRHSTGRIIFLSDQDDVWLENKVGTMLQALKQHAMVMSDAYVVDKDLQSYGSTYFKTRPYKVGIFANIVKSRFLGCCMAFRREVLESALPFPQYGVAHDLWLGVVAIRFHDVHFINQPLMKYRRHTSTVTDAGKSNHTSFGFKIYYRLYVLKACIARLC